MTLSSIGDGVIATDSNGRVTFLNPAAEALTGWQQAEAAGRPLNEVFCISNELTGGPVEDPVAKVLRLGMVVGLANHTKLTSRSGREVPIDDCGAPIRDDGGAITGAVLVFHDVTERRRAEQERARLVAILEATPDLVSFSDPQGRVLYMNHGGRKLLGLADEEPLRTLADYYPPDVIDLILNEAIPAAMRQGSWSGETRFRGRDGRMIPCLQVIVAHKNEDGSVDFFSTTAHDVSDRKRAEETLRASEERFRSVFEHSRVATALTDTNHRFLRVNAAFAQMLGYSQEELLKRSMADITHPDDLAASYARAEALTRGEVVSFGWEKRYLHKDGRVVWGLVSVSRVQGAADQPLEFVVQVQDITERKRAEEELRQRKDFLDQLIRHLPVAVFVKNPCDEFRYELLNEKATELFNFVESEVIGRHDFDIHRRDMAEFFRSKDEETMARRRVIDIPEEFYEHNASGQILLHTIKVPLYDEAGKPTHLLGIAEDITEQRRREDEVRLLQTIALDVAQSEDLRSALEIVLRRVCEASGAVLGQAWLLEPDLSILSCSPAWYCSVEGMGPFRLLSERLTFVPGVGLPGRVWASKQPAWIENVARDVNFPRAPAARQAGLKAGLAIPVLADGQVVAVLEFFLLQERSADERLLQLIGSIATQLGTVTRRKQAEEELRRSQRRYETLVNSVEGIVWEADARSFAFTFVSRQAERLLGYPVQRWLREPTFWRDHIHPDDREAALASWWRATQEQRDYNLTYRMISASGKEVWLHDLVNVVVEAGQVVALRGVMVDVTQQMRLEEQFRQVQKMEAVGRLAGGVAHDFNNLLTAIMGYSQMLLISLPGTDPSRELITEIHKAGERAARLTRQLLAFSRKQVLKLHVLNFNTVVTGMQKMLGTVIGEDIDLVTRLDPHLGLVKADLGQLEQVIINLAVNARDAMPGGGRLTLETANEELDESFTQEHPDVKPGPYVSLAVCDTGCGMDAATLARLFEPFFTTKEQGKGTGLGLATVYGIIKQTGGHIGVTSKPGHGTTLKVYLPRLAEAAPLPEVVHQPNTSWPRGCETVLLVEDDKAVREFSRSLLEQAGYHVLEAPDGAEALRISGNHGDRIHLLVTDVVMPGMSGRELADRLTSMRPGLQVLYLSGYTNDAVIGRGVVESETAFLQKPFGPDDLAAKVRQVLDQQVLQTGPNR